MEETSHPCIKGHNSKHGFCTVLHLLLYILQGVYTVYFSSLQVKNKLCDGVTNVSLFLGLLEWLWTMMTKTFTFPGPVNRITTTMPLTSESCYILSCKN
jgi:hypothetical protein